MRATAIRLRLEDYAAYGPVAAVEEATPRAEAANHAATEVHGLARAALAVAAPFIGLAFVVLAPFAGLAALAWFAARAFAAHWPRTARTARDVALFLVAPFIGLAYAAAFPFVAFGALVWLGARAARARRA